VTRRLLATKGIEITTPILIHGDNIRAMTRMLKEGTRAQLVYLDPPFMSQKKYVMEDGSLAFDDRWLDRGHYLDHLTQRVRLIWELLSHDGSMVIHCDPKMSHYIKCFCDEIFGEDHFASEIIWRYRRWPTKTPNFQRVHDVLLRYRKDITTPPRFVQFYEPLAPSTLEQWGTTKQQALFDEHGHRTKSSKTSEPSKGVPLGDVWDIGVIAPVSTERSGFPTQKPLKLLRQLIGTLTYEGDTVLDPYCGSGTTLVAAKSMGRRAIGIDSSKLAIKISEMRLENTEAFIA